MSRGIGHSIDRRSAWPWLGYYVNVRNERVSGDDAGTWRILFEVPARLRTSDWPPTISLPFDKPYCTGPRDYDTIKRVQADAADLYRRLREGKEPPEACVSSLPGSIPWLIRRWGGQRALDAVLGRLETLGAALEPGTDGREEWRLAEPSTRRFYIQALRPVIAFSQANQHRHVRGLKAPVVREFLDEYADRPGQQKNVRAVLSQLMAIAVEEGEIRKGDNPVESLKRRQTRNKRKPKRFVSRWFPEDVEFRAGIALQPIMGRHYKRPWPGGAALIRLMWQTAADRTDVVAWRKREHFRDGRAPCIVFARGKTDQPALIRISDDLAREIRDNGSMWCVTDPEGRPYEALIDDARLVGHLRTLEAASLAAGGRKLLWDHLRHSAITHAHECGIAVDRLRHLSAHATSRMNEDVYLQMSAAEAEKIQRARGIIS
ncbi:MAG: hypothetical protein AB7J28_15805 [Hyphomonadaceae bacterium]